MNYWLRRKRYSQRLRREWQKIVTNSEWHDREWWRNEALRMRTDRSSLLRQRLRVLWWVRLGKPPWREFMASTSKVDRDDEAMS